MPSTLFLCLRGRTQGARAGGSERGVSGEAALERRVVVKCFGDALFHSLDDLPRFLLFALVVPAQAHPNRAVRAGYRKACLSVSTKIYDSTLILGNIALGGGYRRCATRSDLWRAYPAAFPARTHRGCGKKEGKTCHVERWFCTLRQRVSRLVHKTLSLSKCPENHLDAIHHFIITYHLQTQEQATIS